MPIDLSEEELLDIVTSHLPDEGLSGDNRRWNPTARAIVRDLVAAKTKEQPDECWRADLCNLLYPGGVKHPQQGEWHWLLKEVGRLKSTKRESLIQKLEEEILSNEDLLNKNESNRIESKGYNLGLSRAIAVVHQHEISIMEDADKADSCLSMQPSSTERPKERESIYPLFKYGAFTSHSGLHLPDKIDCDALTKADWDTLAAWVARRIDFKAAIGIPNGGLAFAQALQQHCKPKGCTLIVDDVLTTGASMEKARCSVEGLSCGVVVFARGKLPDWVIARFIENIEIKDGKQK